MDEIPKKQKSSETKWGIRFSNDTLARVLELRGRYDTTTEGFINILVQLGLDLFDWLPESQKDKIAEQIVDWDNARSHEYRKPVNLEGRRRATIQNSISSADAHRE